MYYEIKTDAGSRPGHPEDNMLIIEASSIGEAITIFDNHRGEILQKDKAVACRQIYYVYSFNQHIIS